MQPFCNFILLYQIHLHLFGQPELLQDILGYLPVVSNNDKLLAKFYSGTLRIMDTMRLMSLF